MKKILIILCCIFSICSFNCISCQAKEATVALDYINTVSVTTSLSFDNTTACCSVCVRGKQNTSSIRGTLTLVDETSNRNVASWNVSSTSVVCSTSKNVAVTKGHSYKLSFAGTVKNTSNITEQVSSSTSKKCN